MESTALSAEELDLASRMRWVMRYLRAATPPTVLPAPAGVRFAPTRWAGRAYMQPMLWFATLGCPEYGRTGGCTMCDFGVGAVLPQAEVFAAVRFWAERLQDRPRLHLDTPRSFFDDAEMKPFARAELLRILGTLTECRALGLESRPEHVTSEGLVEVASILKSSRPEGGGLEELSVGVGLEVYSPVLSHVVVNKGFDRTAVTRVIEAASAAERALAGTKVGVETHVLLKPPLVSEREAVEDAVKAIEWSLTSGASRVILMVAAAKEWTLSGWLHRNGAEVGLEPYEPPSLWSAVEVLRRVPESLLENIRVYGFIGNFDNDRLATGCPRCSFVLAGALYEFNVTGRLEALAPVLDLPCECRDIWQRLMEADPGPLLPRLQTALDLIKRAMTGGLS
jgi:radical SAM enzyme (TIGR01210 family)